MTLPTDRAGEVAERLREANIFMVPLSKGVRVALCSIPTQQIYGLAARVKELFK